MRTKPALFLIAAIFFTVILFAPTAAAQTAQDPHLAKAMDLRGQALSAFDSGNYDAATVLARQAKAELALIPGALPIAKVEAPVEAAPVEATPVETAPVEAAPEKPALPASYTVRLIPEDRDCLSKIAGYSFIYGDRAKWIELYKANKGTLKHPENADIILPGEVLVIPSISGEAREGTWEDGKEYPSFSASR
jgi:nucleoid-associated protein YgaU